GLTALRQRVSGSGPAPAGSAPAGQRKTILRTSSGLVSTLRVDISEATRCRLVALSWVGYVPRVTSEACCIPRCSELASTAAAWAFSRADRNASTVPRYLCANEPSVKYPSSGRLSVWPLHESSTAAAPISV